MTEKLTIRLHVYDTEIPVNIPRQLEEEYRGAAKLITDTLNAYASRWKGTKSDKDLMYMALIDIALKLKIQQKRDDVGPINDILSTLTSEIEGALGEK